MIIILAETLTAPSCLQYYISVCYTMIQKVLQSTIHVSPHAARIPSCFTTPTSLMDAPVSSHLSTGNAGSGVVVQWAAKVFCHRRDLCSHGID